MASNQSNPRKFSEKIALHNQKQAEETAAFEKIMQEVGSATSRTNANSRNGVRSTQHLGISSINSSCRGGSLPNVNSPLNSTPSIDLQMALNNLKEIQSGRDGAYRDRRQGVGNSVNLGGGMNPGPGPGPGPLRSRPVETRRVDSTNHIQAVPYGMSPAAMVPTLNSPLISTHQMLEGFVGNPNGTSYLSPPTEPSWRRTHSDSALHQAAMASCENLLLGTATPQITSRKSQEGQTSLTPDIFGTYGISSGPDGRPKSCIDVSRMTSDSGAQVTDTISVQIPIGNNTGSLPDLTNLQFPSPIPNPLDEADPSHSQTHYATSPHYGSPGNGFGSNFDLQSVNSMNAMAVNSPSGGGLSPGGHVPSSSRGSSPGPSLTARRRPRYQVQNLYNKHHVHQSSQPQSPGLTLDNSGTSLPTGYNTYLCQQGQRSPADYSQPASPVHSPQSQPISMHGSLIAPHTSRSLLRPSPQSSPSLCVPGSMAYRSNSPGDTSLVNSAPPSPVSQSLSPASSPGLASSPNPFADMTVSMMTSDQGTLLSNSGHNEAFFQNEAKVVQHQLEQFTMMDTRSDINSQHYGYYKPNNPYQASMRLPLNLDASLDGLGYDGSQQSFYGMRNSSSSQQPTANQTPQTPSSIPEIIIDDFFSLSSVDALRGLLGPINFDDQQMLTDPDTSIVTDPATEDHFRLDRL